VLTKVSSASSWLPALSAPKSSTRKRSTVPVTTSSAPLVASAAEDDGRGSGAGHEGLGGGAESGAAARHAEVIGHAGTRSSTRLLHPGGPDL